METLRCGNEGPQCPLAGLGVRALQLPHPAPRHSRAVRRMLCWGGGAEVRAFPTLLWSLPSSLEQQFQGNAFISASCNPPDMNK